MDVNVRNSSENMSKESTKRTIIRDPIHSFIDLSYYPFIIRIVHSPYFQRLRRVSQLGVSMYVYPSATHTRFTHALGSMEVFIRLFDLLYKDNRSSEYEYENDCPILIQHAVIR